MKMRAFGASALVHGIALSAIATMLSHASVLPPATSSAPAETITPPTMPRLIFVLPNRAGSAGGGGGGNQQPGPIRRAEGVGHDRSTLRTRRLAAPAGALVHLEEPPPAVLLDARPLASGNGVQAGLPSGGVSSGTALGSGSGGGVGTGTGTGIGPGRGPGLGPGTDGGTGGGRYRPGGGVSSPRIIVRVDPHYTSEALERRIQGEVWLELVVTSSGMPTDVRILRSLDSGLDEEAIKAVRQWRFAPGMLAARPVDVEVVVVMAFIVH
jgi:periplasmic protein TonB